MVIMVRMVESPSVAPWAVGEGPAGPTALEALAVLGGPAEWGGLADPASPEM